MRLKLDLLITLILNLVKAQPKVREVLLSAIGDITKITREDRPISDAEISAFEESVARVILIANDTLKSRSVNEMASIASSSEEAM